MSVQLISREVALTWPDPATGPEAQENRLGVFSNTLRGSNVPIVPELSSAMNREGTMPFDVRVEGSFQDALTAARKLADPAQHPMASAIAVLAAVDGSYALFGMGSNSYNHHIDGPLFEQMFADSRFTKTNPALKAIVGTSQWMDLRTSNDAGRQALPTSFRNAIARVANHGDAGGSDADASPMS